MQQSFTVSLKQWIGGFCPLRHHPLQARNEMNTFSGSWFYVKLSTTWSTLNGLLFCTDRCAKSECLGSRLGLCQGLCIPRLIPQKPHTYLASHFYLVYHAWKFYFLSFEVCHVFFLLPIYLSIYLSIWLYFTHHHVWNEKKSILFSTALLSESPVHCQLHNIYAFILWGLTLNSQKLGSSKSVLGF